MPLFFLLAGAVYKISEKPDEHLNELVIKKVKRLIVPYFLTGIFFMFPIKYLCDFYNSQSIFKALNAFWKGKESGHLWFLVALFWCFIIFYFCNKYIGRKSIFALLIVAYIIQQIPNFIKFDFFQLQEGLAFFFWFSLGYSFEIIRPKINIVYKWILFVAAAIIIGFDYLNGYFLNTFFCISIYSLETFLLADLIYHYFHKIVEFKLYKIILRNAMFIYLFHDPLEYICLKFSFQYNLLTFNWGCYLYLIIRTFGVIIISVLIGEIIRSVKRKIISYRLYYY
jgi:hypothetical protein